MLVAPSRRTAPTTTVEKAAADAWRAVACHRDPRFERPRKREKKKRKKNTGRKLGRGASRSAATTKVTLPLRHCHAAVDDRSRLHTSSPAHSIIGVSILRARGPCRAHHRLDIRRPDGVPSHSRVRHLPLHPSKFVVARQVLSSAAPPTPPRVHHSHWHAPCISFRVRRSAQSAASTRAPPRRHDRHDWRSGACRGGCDAQEARRAPCRREWEVFPA